MVGVMTIFPVVFPVAEKLGRSGKEVIEASIIAHEVSSRIGLACLPATDRGFFAVPVFGAFGAAIAAAKLMKLSTEQVMVAISLAASQAAGTLRQHDSMTHYVETGFPCRSGVMAAMLAEAGFSADMNILEDTNHGVGFCTAVAGKDGFRIEKVTEGLGKESRFELLDTKHFPCHSYQQRAIEAAMDVMMKNNIVYKDIESVTVEMKPMFVRQLDLADPTDMEHARVSVQQGVAGAILGKSVGVDTFTEMAATSAEFKEARQKVKLVGRPEWEKHGLNDFEIVTIKLKNGKIYTSPKWESWRGHHSTPFTREELLAKFKNATGDTLSPRQIERAIELVLDLDNLKNVNELMKILTFPG
jgi:2-methylcitrate dehydratase PrpD